MNLTELVNDDRGYEMLQVFRDKDSPDLIKSYSQILEYVNRVGIDEAYAQYQAMQDKLEYVKEE